ncbi:hypothetical protein [Streptomyces bicolor]|uniref:hypothetical protein n=1 Tax=Streptomyces bicolor TaxID=66874 RepID=UPI0004E115D2|nr:hypothetical protein [Streptomyces bicolor]
MIARTAKREALKVPETGWTKARHLRGKPIRTCLAAVEESGGAARPARTGAESNIVRGED